MNKRERRYSVKELRVQTSENGEKVIGGYAVVYNSLSEDMGFREMVAPGAFTEYLKTKPDVRCLFNHDDNLILGRTTSGTLQLTDDDHGLAFRCVLPDTTVANDLAVSIARGDVSQNSFGFVCDDADWTQEKNYMLRTITSAKVFDVSPVVFPAYEATNVSMRSLFPDGDIEIPKELRAETESNEDQPVDSDDTQCPCACPPCVAGDCSQCSDVDCAYEECCSEMRVNKLLASVIERRLR